MKGFYCITLFFLAIQNMAAQPIIIAHRGSSFTSPENTVAAAKLAWEQDADAVELDIYLSHDNRVMVMHDSNTKRTTGQTYPISETSSDVLRTLDAGSWKSDQYKGEKIPFLEEMIATMPANKKMVIEIKCGIEVLPALQQVVEECGKKDQLIFIAFGWEIILAAKQFFPSNKCYWLSSSATEVSAKMNKAAQKGLDGINLNYKIVDLETVNKAKELSLEVFSWTIDDLEVAKRLIQFGVSGITTNRPDLIRQSIQ
jgi:glycerophosphoryl diester phosphodiesterase